MTRTTILALFTFALAAPATGFEYAQDPVLRSMNACTGSGSEIADDIPSVYAGEVITDVTLYVGEWLAPWTEPDGLVIRFYDGTCAPPLVHVQEFAVDWSTLSPVYYGDIGSSGTAFEVAVPLPEPVVVGEATSMGVSVANSWGGGPPYSGFLTGDDDQISGCGELYWDYLGTAPRWTACSSAVNFSADLAFRVSGAAMTSAPAWVTSSWGRLKGRYR